MEKERRTWSSQTYWHDISCWRCESNDQILKKLKEN